MDETELMELGLTELESKAYFKIFKNPLIRSGELAKKLEIHRITCYDILKRLEEKGLVSKIIKENTTFFQSSEPEQIMNILNSQEELLKRKKEKFSNIIKELKKEAKNCENKTNIEFFEGLEGIKRILNKLVSKKESSYKTLGQGIEWINFSEEYLKNYYSKKEENKIKSQAIVPDKKENRKECLWNDKNSERKFIQDKEYQGIITITSEEVFYLNMKNGFVGFSIKNKDFAKMQNILFEQLWKSAKK